MTTTVLIIYVLILSYVAFRSYSKVENYSDFFIARKKGSYAAITGSLVATILGGSAVIGAIDAGHRMGWSTSWFMLCASIGLLALLPLTKRISKLGRYTLPELLEDLYGKQTKMIASIVIPIAWLGIIAAQVIASARLLSSFIGLDYSLGVIISGLVFTAYTIAGGQISILKTDLIQAIFILTGIFLLGFFTFSYSTPETITITDLGFPFNSNFKPIDLLILIITYASTFTAGPDIYSRIFCANNEKTARRAIVTTAIILIPTAFIIAYLSVFGTTLNPSSEQGSILVLISQTVLPQWVIPLVVVALISAVLSSADTTILSASIIVTDVLEKNKFGKKSLRKTRISIFIIGLLSIIIALLFTSIIEMLLIALAIYSGAFIIPILIGLTGTKIKPSYVSMAVITGGILALTGKLIHHGGNTSIGNYIIIGSFLANGIILFLGKEKKTLKRIKPK
jgi:SSS family solute:Na+ symporter